MKMKDCKIIFLIFYIMYVFWLRNKKIIFLLRTLNFSPDLRYSKETCISFRHFFGAQITYMYA